MTCFPHSFFLRFAGSFSQDWLRLRLCLLLLALFGLLPAYRLLPRFLHDLTSDDPLNQVYYTSVQFFGATIEIPRSSAEARSELQKLIGSGTSDANLYRLLAEQDERVLDLAAAEAHLKQYVERAEEKAAAYGVLAGFYEKHLRFGESVGTLLQQAEAVRAESAELPVHERPRYRSLHHAIDLIKSRKLDRPDILTLHRRVLELYPDEVLPHRELLAALLERKQHDEALRLLERYRQRFPLDAEYALHTQARLLENQGKLDAALDVYARSYEPRWSDSLLNGYLALLRRAGRFEASVQSLGLKLKENPTDFPAVTLLFRSTLNQGDLEAARSVLFRFREEKESRNQPFSDDELETLGRYFHSLNHFNEAARYFSTLALQTRTAARKEESLFQLYQVMLDALNRPTQLGGGSLGYFQSVATLDTGPGMLNGMLSLILNRSYPRLRFDEAEERAVSYFNRARAAELLEFFESAYPNSARLPRMQYQALEALKAYGRWETIAQRGAAFLDRHPEALEAPAAGILVADAFANLKNEAEEFKVYDRLLTLLNSRPHRFVPNQQPGASGGMRNSGMSGEGNSGGLEGAGGGAEETQQPEFPSLVSGEPASAVRDRAELETARLQAVNYSYVLERTASRLTAAKRYLEVVALFRKELERNPNEEALYARFAEYLNQHRFFREEMETYQQAIDRFNRSRWYDKLARWYLRQKRQADFAALSRKFVDAFKGTELEEYFSAVVSQVRSNAFYEELNLYANRRFPHNRVFARNLADVYASSSRTFPQWEAIAQRYFFEDKQIRDRYYSYLSWRGRLQPMLAELAALEERNLAQTRFLADALVWRSDFEQSLPHYQSLVALYPTEPETINLTSDLLRSLGVYSARHTAESARLRENLVKWSPDDREALTRLGETYADVEAYALARQSWRQIPAINVSDAALHLETATLFWDYYLFDDSLQAILEYRRLSGNSTALGYEAGAIYEDRRDRPNAIAEYVAAAALGRSQTEQPEYEEPGVAAGVGTGGDDRAYRRLRFLALRRGLSGEIDAEFRKRLQSDERDYPFALAYSRYLENLKRLDDLRKFLLERVTAARERSLLNRVQPLIQQHGFYEVQEAGLKRQIELASVAGQRLSLELELARFYESRSRLNEARSLLERLQTANPKSLGLIQDLESFYWRHNWKSEAIALLGRALPLANAHYRRRFLFDQAQKLSALKQYDEAIRLGQQLLAEHPLDSSYSGFVAQTLALAGRHAELPAFYRDQLQAIRQSSLAPGEKQSRTIAFRRGMIEAQVALRDFTAALDQFVEIINLNVEDVATLKEAADFAQAHQLEVRLRDYYHKTAQQSPQDHRWPLVLARLEEHWGRLAESVRHYEAALAIRLERIDLYEAKAALEQRLLDFPAALQTYDRLYGLSYKNPVYLLKSADLQARLGNRAVAVETLKRAYGADVGLPVPQYFKIVEQLKRWGYPDDAKPFIDEGWRRFTERSGSDFMGGNGLLQPAVEVSVQHRDVENTFHALRAEYQKLETLKGQPGGPQAYANQEIVSQAFLDLGKAIDQYFSPEEKAGVQSFLEKVQPPLTLAEKETFALKLAEAAGLFGLQESLLITLAESYGQRLTPNSNENDSRYRAFLGQLIEFYRRRQAYEKAASSLVSLWERNPQRQRLFSDLIEPALAARKLGEAALEMSILEKYAGASGGLFNPAVLQRYYELLAELNQETRILQISQRDTRLIPALANALIDRQKLELARAVIQNYGRRKTPVWTATQLAMTGAYLGDSTPQVAAAFNSVLNLKPIGELLGAPADESRLLYSAEWYFYARRFGEHLFRLKNPQADEILAAQIEFAPVSSFRQAQLGRFYLENLQLPKAQTHFEQALELEPASSHALDGQALVWMKQNETQRATENWLKMLAWQDQQFSLPGLQQVLQRVREFRLEAAFRKPAEDFLKSYVKRNQTYGIEKVLPPALEIFGSPAEKSALLKTLAEQTQTFPFVERLLRLRQIQDANLPLEPVYESAIEWQRRRLEELGGEDRNFQLGQLIEFELGFAEVLLKSRGEGRVEALLDRIQQDLEGLHGGSSALLSDPISRRVQFLRAQLFLQTNRAEAAKALLQSIYQRKEPIHRRREDYQRAAGLLRQARLPVAARAVSAELYLELIKSDPLLDANYIGLAQVYLEGKQPAAALETLEKMRLSSADNQEGYRLAAELLWRYRSTKLDNSGATLGDKAREVWRNLLKLNPQAWEGRLRLAEVAGRANLPEAQGLLKAVIEARQSTYQQKVEAARIAGRTGATGLTFESAELRAIAEIESRRNAPKSAVSAFPALSLPGGFYGPLHAARSPVAPGAAPALDNLRQALFLRPMSGGTQEAHNSRLFGELIKALERARKPGLLVDLFEQYGNPRRSDSHFHYDTRLEDGAGALNDTLIEFEEGSLAPQPLAGFSLAPAEKVTLVKAVINAYVALEAYDSAAQVARAAASIAAASRQEFDRQARQLETRARQASEAWAARFSVSDTLGEELSQRKPLNRPRRARVRS